MLSFTRQEGEGAVIVFPSGTVVQILVAKVFGERKMVKLTFSGLENVSTCSERDRFEHLRRDGFRENDRVLVSAGGDTIAFVVKVGETKARLGFEGPTTIKVHRLEVWREIAAGRKTGRVGPSSRPGSDAGVRRGDKGGWRRFIPFSIFTSHGRAARRGA